MFHFPAFPPQHLYIQCWVTRHHSCRVSPFGHPRIHARLTTPRGISQPPTSFIGSQCQGIHHAPFNTYKHKKHKNQKKIAQQTNKHQIPKNPPLAHLMLATTIHKSNTTPHHQSRATTHPLPSPGQDRGPVVSKPNSVSGSPSPQSIPLRLNVCCAPNPGPLQTTGFLTAQRFPNGTVLSWCSLERR